ncbi:CAMK family protein kinase [Tritrichomonas foetus]|uniref:CAMK family protein kinase n=1 Tax=Tritrichomonas foetus TaxID=1144522 RepID=A0A1J4JD02_9EUKA|nr:CAMK family protein kinase [Tritrichomonas foetus]|eukprot:OHS95547.1 CAMK family protein kinase [Tritrichomonas foetus]
MYPSYCIDGIHSLSKLGKGTFSKVFLGEHDLTHLKVALKVINKSTNLSPERIKKIFEEIDILQSLDHPFIIKFLKNHEDSENYYIVQEYAPNGSILDYLNNNTRLTEAMARRFFTEILIAAEFMHKNHVFHRDLKAENILLDENNNIKIIDFGMSTHFNSYEALFFDRCGSLGYAAPEVIKNKGYTAKSDIWSIGVILYALLIGELPFKGNSDAEIIENLLYSTPAYPTHLSANSIDLLKKLLDKNPKSRISLHSVKEHPWISQTEYSIISRVTPDTKLCNILDKDLVVQMAMLNLDITSVTTQKLENKYGEERFTYLLLQSKKIVDTTNNIIECKIKSIIKEIRRSDPSVDHEKNHHHSITYDSSLRKRELSAPNLTVFDKRPSNPCVTIKPVIQRRGMPLPISPRKITRHLVKFHSYDKKEDNNSV